MAYLLLSWLIGALSLMIVAHVIPGFVVSSFGAALVAALVISLVNSTIGLVLKILTFPLTILTFGLFLLVLNAFLDRNHNVHAVRTPWGTTSFMRLSNGDADGFLARLRSDWETSAVPGRFFETPGCFRVGMGVNSEMFAEGLSRLERAL